MTPAFSIAGFLSSYFMAPLFLAFLGLVPIIILLYLLKLRRTEILIPSTMLWSQSLHDLTANAPFQRLILNLLLILQIIITILLVGALVRPFIQSSGFSGHSLCLFIDRSASMNAREGETTRLELAQAAALAMVDEMKGGDKMMVVSFAAQTDVLAELTDDRARLRRAISGIKPSDTRTEIHDALMIARSLSPDNPDVPAVAANLELVLISDGRLSDPDELGETALNINYLKIGASDDNMGIAAFNVRTPPDQPDQRQAFTLTVNDAPEPASTTLSLYLGDELLAVEEIEVPAKSRLETVFELSNLDSGMLRAELDRGDALPTDNRAWLALQPRRTVTAVIAARPESAGAYFLAHALELDPRIELASAAPADFAATGDDDLIIFENWAPQSLPEGTLVFINSVPPLDGITSSGTIENPPVLAVDPDHPLMRFLTMANVRVSKCQKLALPPGARTLVSTKGGALIADVSRGGQQIVVIGFDLADSSWPLNLSFPLFIQNLVSWVPKAQLTGETSLATGSPIAILPEPEITSAAVTRPDGSRENVPLDPLRPVFYARTETAGVYAVERGDEKEYFAVNLLDVNESAIAPAESLALGKGRVEGQTGDIRQTRELWRWLIVLALGVLSLEWWIYSRRAWI